MDIAEYLRQTLLAIGVAPLVFALLLLLGVVLALSVDRALFFARTHEPLGCFAVRLTARLQTFDLAGARKLAASSRSAEAAVVGAGLRQYERGAGATAEAMAGAIAVQSLRLAQRLWLLRALGWSALFVGAVATLVGSLEGGPSPVGPLALGLAIAGLTFGASSYFRHRIRVSLGNAHALSHLLLSALEGGNLLPMPGVVRNDADLARTLRYERDDYDPVPSSA